MRKDGESSVAITRPPAQSAFQPHKKPSPWGAAVGDFRRRDSIMCGVVNLTARAVWRRMIQMGENGPFVPRDSPLGSYFPPSRSFFNLNMVSLLTARKQLPHSSGWSQSLTGGFPNASTSALVRLLSAVRVLACCCLLTSAWWPNDVFAFVD